MTIVDLLEKQNPDPKLTSEGDIFGRGLRSRGRVSPQLDP
jgi:hypothetical protein